jgi:hypothetical protein
MKGLLTGALAVLLGFVAASAWADDPNGHSTILRPGSAAAVTLGGPVALDAPVTLERPTPLESDVALVSYETPAPLPAPVVRMQSADSRLGWVDGNPTPMPARSSLFAVGDPHAQPATPAPAGNGPVEHGATCCGDGMTCGDDCTDPSCCCDDCCGHCCRLYGSAEYLLWWIRSANLPPLVTTSSPANMGILGMGDTRVVFGGSPIPHNEYSGGRFTIGYWCDCCETKGIEGTFFFLAPRSISFFATSNQFPVLARPFFDLNNGVQSSERTASPGLGTGNLSINAPSRLWGAELNGRCNVCCDDDICLRVDMLGGFRFLQLNEGLNIDEHILVDPGQSTFASDLVTVSDRFATRNNFYGAQIGAVASFKCDCWSLDFRGKVALGDTHQAISIGGDQVLIPPAGAPTVVPGGLLALNSNSGTFTRDRFSVVPEWGVNLGYNVTDHLKLTFGYTFIYWSNVVRPGDQVDRGLDITRIPNFVMPGQVVPPVAGSARPAVPFKETSFWAQGMNFGLEYTY